MKKVSIYALVDPRTGETRYIGKANNVKRRVQNHLCPNNLKRTRHVCRWLAGLVMLGLAPEVVILETVTVDWEAAERKWISAFRAKGVNLTNILDGGEGGATYGRLGKKNSPEMIAKTRASRIGKSINQRDPDGKRSEAIRASWQRRREVASIRGEKLSWGKHSEATKQSMSRNAKGRDMTALIKRSADLRRGKPSPKKVSHHAGS